jgi:cyanophycin synthetase
VLGVPGDRSDELIRESARAVAGVDRVIVREDDDPRGRTRGQIAAMLCDVLRQEQPSLPVDTVLGELDSIDAAVARIQPGEVVIVFADDVNGVAERLRTHGAEPVDGCCLLAPPTETVAQPAA